MEPYLKDVLQLCISHPGQLYQKEVSALMAKHHLKQIVPTNHYLDSPSLNCMIWRLCVDLRDRETRETQDHMTLTHLHNISRLALSNR